MDEINITKYVIEEALILIPALWILGKFLKATPRVPDWCIPWVLLVLGIGGALGLIGITPKAAIQGVLVAGAAVLVHQLGKQTDLQDRFDDDAAVMKQIRERR